MQLSPVQVRILGCLIEKERTTPDNYPLTTNALLAACNQTTNRYPVVSFSEATLTNAVENLRAENLLRLDYSRSNRAEKYRHVLGQALGLGDAELALLSVLMVRGPQTAAELRARAERLHHFGDHAEVEAALARMAARPEPLVVQLDPAAGQKERRWAHLLAGDAAPVVPAPAPPSPRQDRMAALESAVSELQEEVRRLRAEQEALASLVRGRTE